MNTNNLGAAISDRTFLHWNMVEKCSVTYTWQIFAGGMRLSWFIHIHTAEIQAEQEGIQSRYTSPLSPAPGLDETSFRVTKLPTPIIIYNCPLTSTPTVYSSYIFAYPYIHTSRNRQETWWPAKSLTYQRYCHLLYLVIPSRGLQHPKAPRHLHLGMVATGVGIGHEAGG